MSIPDLDQYLSEAWGWPSEGVPAFCGASNIVIGTNPPYNVADFLSIYPKFGGAPTILPGTFTAGSPVVTATSAAALAVGQPVAPGIVPAGTLIQSVDSSTQITLTNSATSSGTQLLTVFPAPALPYIVLNAYIALASASLVQARWQATWQLGMAAYIAHYATLWLRSDGDTLHAYSTSRAIAQAGLAQGITVSASAGPVSESIQPVGGNGSGLESWGHWNQTEYGIQFVGWARIIGAGPMLIW
jgi:hypothetical protein